MVMDLSEKPTTLKKLSNAVIAGKAPNVMCLNFQFKKWPMAMKPIVRKTLKYNRLNIR